MILDLNLKKIGDIFYWDFNGCLCVCKDEQDVNMFQNNVLVGMVTNYTQQQLKEL